MDFWAAVQMYAIISAAIAGTSYFRFYRPAIDLTEEIVDESLPGYKDIPAVTVWLCIAFVLSPITTVMLLRNNNKDFIEKLALVLANRIIEEEE